MIHMWTKPSYKYQQKFGFVRKTNCYLSDQQANKLQQALVVENQLYNYALRYLYKTYGRKHMDRRVPTKMAKRYLVNKIKAMFLRDCYQLKRWNFKKLALSSHNAQLFLVQLITNFAEYKKDLVRNNKKMDTKQRFNFKMNIQKNKHGKHTNPKHKSWYRIGGIGFNADNRTILIDLQPQAGLRVISMHKIIIPDYGLLRIQGNAYKLCMDTDIQQVKLKLRPDNTYQLQLVHTAIKPKFSLLGKDAVGLDWNMIGKKYFHDSNNHPFSLSDDVVKRADAYEQLRRTLQSKRDRTHRHFRRLNKRINRLYVKREQLLTEAYRKAMPEVTGNHQVFVIEKLNSKDMRKPGKSSGKNRGFNRKLALIRPAILQTVLANYVWKHGGLVIQVDAYKTSQTEFGTMCIHKHPLIDREFPSDIDPTKTIDRDWNAAKNILDWGLHPDHHVKVKLFKKVQPEMVADFM